MQKTVTMALVPKQAEQLIEQLFDLLEPKAKLRLVERLERESRLARWKPLVSKMRARFANRPLSTQEIRRLCEQARQERFERAARCR